METIKGTKDETLSVGSFVMYEYIMPNGKKIYSSEEEMTDEKLLALQSLSEIAKTKIGEYLEREAIFEQLYRRVKLHQERNRIKRKRRHA